ncbi:hypothetical protein DESC_600108 [Desulfosarcina cetonica]|nr:hypothetical protein DESC_600108 [Desulfosarcina cetonica]
MTRRRIQHVVDKIQRITGGPAIGEHEQGAADGKGAVEGALLGAFHAVNLEGLDLGVEITDADVTDGEFVVRHSLDNGAVGGHDLGGRGDAFLLHDLAFPGLIGTGGGIPGTDDDLQIRPTDLFIIGNLAHVDVLELRAGDVGQGVAGMHDGDDRVVGHGKGDRIDALFQGHVNFLFLDEAGGVGDIGGPVDEGFDTVTRTATGQGDVHVRVGFHVRLHGDLGNGQHRGRALDHQIPRDGRGRAKGEGRAGGCNHAKQLLHGSLSFVESFVDGYAPIVRFLLGFG